MGGPPHPVELIHRPIFTHDPYLLTRISKLAGGLGNAVYVIRAFILFEATFLGRPCCSIRRCLSWLTWNCNGYDDQLYDNASLEVVDSEQIASVS